jgi:pimeloyl-ACP methyl ester carboxylesterase
LSVNGVILVGAIFASLANTNTNTKTNTRNVAVRELVQPSGVGVGIGIGIEERGEIELTVEGRSYWKRFVIRYPVRLEDWNRALVVGAHGGSGGESYSRDGRVIGTDETALDDVVGNHALANGFAYASVDRDGIGGSPMGLALTHSFAAAVRQRLIDVFDRGLERSYLVGLSMGGAIARYAAEEEPPKFDGVLLVAGAGGDAETRRLRQARMAELWPNVDASSTDDDALIAAYAEAVGTPVEARRFWPFLGSAASSGPAASEARDSTGELRVPAIEVVGTFDDFVFSDIGAYSEKVASRGASSYHRVYSVEGAWHISPDDDAISSFQFVGSRRGLAKNVLDDMATGASYLPVVRDALVLLERWVWSGIQPPPSQTIAGNARLISEQP